LAHAALLPLHAHRLVQAAPSLSNSALHPILWATMAAADFPACIGYRCRCPAPLVWRPAEISRGKTLILPLNAAGFTVLVSVWLLGFPSVAGSPAQTGLVSGSFASSPRFAADFLPAPPRRETVVLG